jgi:hypothetical protein
VAALAEAGFSPSSSLATLAFLVVLRVLIKLFFSMLMMVSPLKILSDDFLLLSTHIYKAWEGPKLCRAFAFALRLKRKTLARALLERGTFDRVKLYHRLKLNYQKVNF